MDRRERKSINSQMFTVQTHSSDPNLKGVRVQFSFRSKWPNDFHLHRHLHHLDGLLMQWIPNTIINDPFKWWTKCH